MRKILKNTNAAIIALIGLIGGILWAINTEWDYEPIILIFVSVIELISFFVLRNTEKSFEQNHELPIQTIESKLKSTNEQNVNLNLSFGQNIEPKGSNPIIIPQSQNELPREEIIDLMKSKVQILFIDDDKKFNVVKNLKDGGWKLTKTLEDIKNVDVPVVKNSYILFVDINGVGKILNLEYEGLDLALMLKQRYPDKKVIIYSANKNSNSFHEAWSICDYRLEKNALPYQFQSLVESYSIELFKKGL